MKLIIRRGGSRRVSILTGKNGLPGLDDSFNEMYGRFCTVFYTMCVTDLSKYYYGSVQNEYIKDVNRFISAL